MDSGRVPASGSRSAPGRPPFYEAFVPLFAAGELRRGLPRVERTQQSGTYRFRVGTGARRQVISLGDDRTLEDLHDAIQGAFRLGGDHLYAFFLDGQRFSDKAVNDPRSDDPPFADEATIGGLDLFVGQRILYLYDFGDEVTLDVELESVEASPPPRSASSAAGGRKRRRGRTRKA